MKLQEFSNIAARHIIQKAKKDAERICEKNE